MWALVHWRSQITIVAVAAVAIAWGIDAVEAYFTGTEVSTLKLASLVGTILVIAAGIVGALWRRVWRWCPWIGRMTFPDLTGTWKGELKSTWIDPATGQPIPPIPTTIWVRQGLFETSIKLRTGESTSHSNRCLLESDRAAGCFRVWYSYDNSPKAGFRHRSARHEGVAWLELDADADTNRLVGRYYTERQTTGDMEFRRESRDIRGVKFDR